MKPAPCASNAHCGHCRDREGGRQFRESFRVVVGMDDVDFECPYGQPWGVAVAVQLPPQCEAFAPRTDTAVRELIETHCESCENQAIGEAVKEWPDGMPGCKKVQTCNGRPCFTRFYQLLANGGACPLGKFNSNLSEAKE